MAEARAFAKRIVPSSASTMTPCGDRSNTPRSTSSGSLGFGVAIAGRRWALPSDDTVSGSDSSIRDIGACSLRCSQPAAIVIARHGISDLRYPHAARHDVVSRSRRNECSCVWRSASLIVTLATALLNMNATPGPAHRQRSVLRIRDARLHRSGPTRRRPTIFRTLQLVLDFDATSGADAIARAKHEDSAACPRRFRSLAPLVLSSLRRPPIDEFSLLS